ncbi:hypothetical protein AALO_G00103270, partial [Alosa alosa]
MAMWMGSAPELSGTLTDAPKSTRARRVSRKPPRAASCAGVTPKRSWMLGSAPCSNSRHATFVFPIIMTC